MTTPRIADHVERRLARLVTYYRNSASHRGVVSAMARQVQGIEDAAFGMLVLRSIGDASGAQLDEIGKLLGVERDGRDDAGLRIRLRAQVIVNSRSGEYDTLLLVLQLLTPPGAGVSLTEYFPASVVARVNGLILPEGPQIAAVLRLAKAAGVNLQLVYQLDTDANVLTLSDANSTSTPGLGLGDTDNAATGGKLAGVS